MAITVTIQPDSSTSKDIVINTNAPDTNYEGNGTLALENSVTGGYKAATLIDFPSIINIPSKAKILRSFLTLNCKYANAPDYLEIMTFEILRNWVANQATWNAYSTGYNWTTAGVGGDGTDATLTSYWGGIRTTVALGSCNVELHPYTAERRIKGLNYGWLLKDLGAAVAGSTIIQFDSSDNATPANRPKLIITYEPYHKIFPMSAGLGQVR